MNQRRSVALAAAAATLLAAAPMSTIFANWTWAFEATVVVAVVSGTAIGARALRAPVWAQLLAVLFALTIIMTWMSHAPAFLGTIPTKATFQGYADLFSSASADIRKDGIPVPDEPGLLFVTSLGIGLVAIAVDLLAVPLRRPAIAGFPMLVIYAIPVFVHEDSVPALPFVLGAAGFLWLLVADNVDRVRRFGRRFTGDGRGVDLWEPSPLAAAGRRLAAVGVVLAVAVPLLIPGMTGGLLERFNGGDGSGSGPGTGSGKGASVNLFAVLAGNLNQNKQFEMLKVSTTNPNPYYLRFAVADRLTPAGFTARPLGTAAAVTAPGGIPSLSSGGFGVTQHAYHAEVTITDFNMPYLPVYQVLTRTQRLDGSWLYDQVGSQVYSLRSSTRGKTYTFDYLATDYSPAALATASSLSARDPMREFTQVVQQQPVVQDRVQKLTAGKGNDYEKVRAIYDFFSASNGFRYALSTKASTSGSDIVDFLTNKQGYCEQYAAAMAWMVRTAGIPARVAFGFTRGASKGPTYSLSNTNLHAWTEVYFTGFGWVPFDATPTASIAGSVSPPWAPDPNRPDPGGPAPAPNASAGGGNPNDPAPHDPGGDPGGAYGGSTSIDTRTATWVWWVLGSLLGLLVLAFVPAVRRTALRRRRYRLPKHAGAPATAGAVDALAAATDVTGLTGQMQVVVSPEAALREAHAAWDELVDTLVDYDIPVDDAQTPRVVASGVAAMLSLPERPAEALRLLGRAEERARYARTPLAVADLGGALRTVRRAVARTASRRTRLQAVLLPPSVLRRWRYAAGATTVAVVSWTGRWRDATVRVLSPRRILPGRVGR
jgi:transglutaminase-like putative cysteine protease